MVLFLVLLVASVATSGSVAAGAGDASPGDGGATADAATAGVTMVTECRMITEPGHYQLANDIVDSTANRCINIQASDVYFDGAGHTIDGVGKYLFTDDGAEVSTKGVLAKNGPHTNVTVTNVEVTEFGYGLWYGETSNGCIMNNTFRSNGIYGLYVGYGADDNLIVNNVVRDIRIEDPDHYGAGIVVANYAHGNLIEGNDVRSIERFGIEVAASENTTIRNNTVVDTGGHGIAASRPGNVIVDNTVLRSDGVGIIVRRSPGVRVADNAVRDSQRGIAVTFSPGAAVLDNVVAGNARHGIHFHGGVTDLGDSASPGSEVAGNTVTDNGEIGILLPRNNNDTVVRDNEVSRNGDVGIKLVRNGGNRLVSNTITDHRIGVVLLRAGGTVLERNTYRDYSEWALLSRDHTTSVSVESARFADDTALSFDARTVAIAAVTNPPESLPEGTVPRGRFLKLWPEGDHAWVTVSVPLDASAVGPAASVDLWVYDGGWRALPAAAVDRGSDRLEANLTVADGTLFVGVGVSRESDTTASPPSTPTASTGQPGFGLLVALVVLVGVGILARLRRE